jgi:diguanylate cyclase
VTISIGATALSRGEDSALLLQRADQAMYQSKQGGRNRVSCIFPNDSN